MSDIDEGNDNVIAKTLKQHDQDRVNHDHWLTRVTPTQMKSIKLSGGELKQILSRAHKLMQDGVRMAIDCSMENTMSDKVSS